MKDFFEEHSGIFHIIEIALMLIMIAFLLFTIKAQNTQIEEMSQTIETMQENSGLTLTMDQVNKSIDTKIEQALTENNLVITKTVTQDIDTAVKGSLDSYKEELYLEIYKQVTSDLKASGFNEEDDKDTEKEEEKETTKKDTTKKTTTKKTTSSNKNSSQSTNVQTPQAQPQNPAPQPPAQNADDGAFVVDEEEF